MTEDKQPSAAGRTGQRVIIWIVVVIVGAAAYYAIDWFFGGL